MSCEEKATASNQMPESPAFVVPTCPPPVGVDACVMAELADAGPD